MSAVTVPSETLNRVCGALNDASLELCHALAVLRTAIDAIESADEHDKNHVETLYAVVRMIERGKGLVDGPAWPRPGKAPEPETADETAVRLDS